MNYNIEKIRDLEKQMEDIISELYQICGEVPSISRNLDMLEADFQILKHSTVID